MTDFIVYLIIAGLVGFVTGIIIDYFMYKNCITFSDDVIEDCYTSTDTIYYIERLPK